MCKHAGMNNPTGTPTSPPTPPIIPVGLGTQVGLAAAAAQFVACLVTVFLNGDHSQETILTLVTATVTLVTVLAGRFAQATAAIKAQPSLLATPQTPTPQTTTPQQNIFFPIPAPVDDEIGGDPLAEESDLVPEGRVLGSGAEVPPDVGDGYAAPGANR